MQSTAPYGTASARIQRSPTPVQSTSRSFGDVLEPRYIFGAGSLD